MKMKEKSSIDIIGVPYHLKFVPYIEAEEAGLHASEGLELQGMCDIDEKVIYINESITEQQQIVTARHEVLHAFFYECGLFNCSSAPQEGWAVHEEMIDFFAIQWDKLNKIYKELGLLEGRKKVVEKK